jgi:hypothetical protein
MYQRVEKSKNTLYRVKTPENRGRTSWTSMPYGSPFLCVCTYLYVHFESPQTHHSRRLASKKQSDFHLIFIVRLMDPRLKAIIIHTHVE